MSKKITTKSGAEITESWCRRCAAMRPASEFFEATDAGKIDTLMLMSVCKPCINDLYDEYLNELGSMEKSLHKLCTSLNVRYSNEALSAAKAHINTMLESGKTTNAIFGIYKMKLVATQKTMEKNVVEDLSYEDIAAVFVTEALNPKEVPISKEVLEFWGKGTPKADIEFLENEYKNFKKTHSTNTYAEVVLLKEACYTILRIKALRANNDDTQDAVKELQALLKSLAISPNSASTNTAGQSDKEEAFGLWIKDIEREEPAQWLKTDPRGDIYRDVGNVEEYFEKYFLRPLKNLILNNKDFNTGDEDDEVDETLPLISGGDIEQMDDE